MYIPPTRPDYCRVPSWNQACMAQSVRSTVDLKTPSKPTMCVPRNFLRRKWFSLGCWQFFLHRSPSDVPICMRSHHPLRQYSSATPFHSRTVSLYILRIRPAPLNRTLCVNKNNPYTIINMSSTIHGRCDRTLKLAPEFVPDQRVLWRFLDDNDLDWLPNKHSENRNTAFPRNPRRKRPRRGPRPPVTGDNCALHIYPPARKPFSMSILLVMPCWNYAMHRSII